MITLSLITIFSFYFFLREEDKLRQWFDQYFYFSKKNGDRFILLSKAICKKILFSNVLTGIVQATIIATGSFFCKTGDFFIVFVIVFLFTFIPTGAAPVGFILAIFAFIDHRVAAGITMSCIVLVSVIIENIMRPYLNSLGPEDVPAFVNILAIFGGVLMMGLPGLFVGPLLASLTYGILPFFWMNGFQKKKKVANHNLFSLGTSSDNLPYLQNIH